MPGRDTRAGHLARDIIGAADAATAPRRRADRIRAGVPGREQCRPAPAKESRMRERLPVERAFPGVVQGFKALPLRGGARPSGT